MIPRRGLLIVLGATALLLLPWLGARDLWNPNEPIYGQAVREMDARSDWLVPTVRGRVFAEKPILYYWIALLAARVTGRVDETSLRLPSVLATLVLVASSWGLARLYVAPRRAALAALLLATTYMVWWGGRTAQMDILIAATTAAALLPLCRQVDRGGSKTLAWVLAGAACGVGVLAKGPIAVLCPALAFTAYLATTGRLLGSGSTLRPAPVLAGVAAGAAVIAPWMGALAARGELGMLREMFVRQNLTRFVDAWDHQQPWWYYGVHVFAGMVPWSFFLPAAVALPGRDPQERRLDRLAWCWLVAVVGFLSLSQSKRNDYLLPVAAAVALLVSGPLDRWIGGGALTRWRARWIAGAHLILAVLVLGGAVALARLAPERAPELTGAARGTAALLGAGGIVFLVALLLRRRRMASATAWGTFAAFYLAAAAALLPAADAFKSARPFCEALAARVPSSQPVATYRFWQWRAGYAFYSSRTFEAVQSPAELQEWLSGEGPRWLLVEDWALPEARIVVPDAPVAISRRVGNVGIVLLGPLD